MLLAIYCGGTYGGSITAILINTPGTSANAAPMLTLGVPGDGATAILMGAFMVHGMIPGPTLFKESGNILYAIMFGLIIVNICMYIIGTGLIPFYANITKLPYELLACIVLTMCTSGAFSTNNRPYDVMVIILFGILAYFLRRMDFQLVPILLGIVLGPLAEVNFRRALVLSDGSASIFFTRPISLFFIVVAVLSIAVFTVRGFKANKTV
jgi:hypothetical protein